MFRPHFSIRNAWKNWSRSFDSPFALYPREAARSREGSTQREPDPKAQELRNMYKKAHLEITSKWNVHLFMYCERSLEETPRVETSPHLYYYELEEEYVFLRVVRTRVVWIHMDDCTGVKYWVSLTLCCNSFITNTVGCYETWFIWTLWKSVPQRYTTLAVWRTCCPTQQTGYGAYTFWLKQNSQCQWQCLCLHSSITNKSTHLSN